MTPTTQQIHNVIANAMRNGPTYSSVQEAAREIQKLYDKEIERLNFIIDSYVDRYR